MISNKLLSATMLAAVAAVSLTLGTGSAEAVKMRKCPDGSWVSCTKPCPGKLKTPGGPQHSQARAQSYAQR
jgi:hypothetical protein